MLAPAQVTIIDPASVMPLFYELICIHEILHSLTNHFANITCAGSIEQRVERPKFDVTFRFVATGEPAVWMIFAEKERRKINLPAPGAQRICSGIHDDWLKLRT